MGLDYVDYRRCFEGIKQSKAVVLKDTGRMSSSRCPYTDQNAPTTWKHSGIEYMACAWDPAVMVGDFVIVGYTLYEVVEVGTLITTREYTKES